MARFASIDQDAAGSTTVVAAVPGYRIVLMNYLVALDAAGSFIWKSGSTQLTGEIPCAEDGGVMASSDNPDWPLMVTAVGEALVLTSAVGVADGHIAYYLDGYGVTS